PTSFTAWLTSLSISWRSSLLTMSNDESATVGPSFVRRPGRAAVSLSSSIRRACDALHAPERPSRFASAARRRYAVPGLLPAAARSRTVRATGAVTADYPSGQRELTVNQLALPTGVRIPHLPRRRVHVIRSTGDAPRVASGQGGGESSPGCPDGSVGRASPW